MSYEKVKSIKIEGDNVFITSKCNNDTEPVKKWECTMLSEILKNEGKEAVEISILKAYEEGNFQSYGDGKYNRALRVLREFPEYAKFDWRNSGVDELRSSLEFDAMLKRALGVKLKREKLIITKEYDGRTIYLSKALRNSTKWTGYKDGARVFKCTQDAKRVLSNFMATNHWNIVNLQA